MLRFHLFFRKITAKLQLIGKTILKYFGCLNASIAKTSGVRVLKWLALLCVVLYSSAGFFASSIPVSEDHVSNKFFALISILAIAIYIVLKLVSKVKTYPLLLLAYILIYMIFNQLFGHRELLFALGNACTVSSFISVFFEIFFDKCTSPSSQENSEKVVQKPRE